MKENKEEVKKIIRSLLLSSKHGLTVNELCTEYTEVTCKCLPYKELGYFSAVDLVKDMSDVIRPFFMSGGVMLLRGIPDSSTAHINELVRRQKSTGANSRIVTQQAAPKPTKKIVPYNIRSKLLELISLYPAGIEMRLFERAYHHYFGKRLQPPLCGFPCLRSLIAACPDIITTKIKLDQVFLFPTVSKDQPKTTKESPLPLMDKIVYAPPDQKPNIGIPDNLKQEIFTVLSKCKNGVWSARFPFEYRVLHKKCFDVQALGFNSVVELMSKLYDLVSIKRPVVNGDWLLFAKGTEAEEVSKSTVSAFDKYSLKSPRELDELIEIYLSYIIDPTAFWFQCVDNLKELDELMDKINEFYSNIPTSECSLSTGDLKVGQPCCGLYEDGYWYRCRINKLISINQVQVFYVDYGNELNVNIKSLKQLKKEFLKLPCQAMKGQLYGIKPFGKSWLKASNEKLYELTNDKHMFGKIVEADETTTSMEIIDTNNDDDVYVSQVLLHAGYALPVNGRSVAGFTTETKNSVSHLESLYREYYRALKQASNTPPDEEKHPSETSHDNVFVTPPSCTSRNHQKSNFNDNTENCNSKNSPVSDTTSNESRDNYQKQVDSFKRQKTSNDQERITPNDNSLPRTNINPAHDEVKRDEQIKEEQKKSQSSVKRVAINENVCIHLVRFNEQPYMTSADVSSLFWDGDIIRQMLRQKGLQLPKEILSEEEKPELFSTLLQFDVKGVKTGETIRSCISLYPLESVLKIFSKFESKYPESEKSLKTTHQLHNSSPDLLWECKKTRDDEEHEEKRLQLQVLKLKKRRLYFSMMTNCASQSTLDELEEIEEKIVALDHSTKI